VRLVSFVLCVVLTLSGTGCIKHKWKGGVPPQPTPYPVLSLSTDKTLAVASMVRKFVNGFPPNSVACLSIDMPKYGEPFYYDPDSAMLKAVHGIVKVVSDKDCPPTYWRMYTRENPQEEVKPPPGYVDPIHVFITDLQFLGANQVKGIVNGTVKSTRYTLPCYARRMSRHNWRPSCPFGTYTIFGP
jgi:hypothetical protein